MSAYQNVDLLRKVTEKHEKYWPRIGPPKIDVYKLHEDDVLIIRIHAKCE